MSVDVCLLAKAEAGKVDSKRASATAAQFRAEADQLASDAGIPVSEAERLTASRMAEDRLRAFERRKRMDLKQAGIQVDMEAMARKAVEEGKSVDQAFKALLELDSLERFKGVSNLATRKEVVRGELHKRMADFFLEFRSKAAGLYSNRANLKNVVREMFGEDTGNRAASELAQGVQAMEDYAIQRFNHAGGDVVRTRKGLRVKHDRSAMAAASTDEWVEFISPLLNRQEMLDGYGRPMTDEALDSMLRNTYRKIVGGRLVEQESAPGSFGSPVNARANESNLVFRDADAWIGYHERFGGENLYDHVVGLSEGWARDIADLEILGPYPDAALAHMEHLIDQAQGSRAIDETGKKGVAAARAEDRQIQSLRNLYRESRGDTEVVSEKMHNIAAGVRNLESAALLGSATVTAIPTDMMTVKFTARMNGIPATRAMMRSLRTLDPSSRADRELALRLGFTARGYADQALGAQRLQGEVMGPGWTSRVAETTMRASGLTPWTQAMQWGFQTMHLAHLTGQAGKRFDQLDGKTQRSLERYGITRSDWDLIRKAPMYIDEKTGASFISAEKIAGERFSGQAFDAANKLQEMLHSEVQYAVISPNARIRSLLKAGTKSGTGIGEGVRFFTQLKAFPAAIVYMHGGRILAQEGAWNMALYGADLVISLTLAGAFAVQAQSIAKGKEPVSWEDMTRNEEVMMEFWKQAFIKGGAGGLFTDLIFTFENQRAGGLLGLAGPAYGTINDLGFLLADAGRMVTGQDHQAGKRLSAFIQRHVPGGTHAVIRTPLERIIFDRLDEQLNRNYRRSFRAMENYARDSLNQRYFWAPGDIVP